MGDVMDTPSIIFMGSPDFAVPALRALHESFGLTAIVSVPDKPSGRGQILQSSAVSKEAISLGIPLLTPERLNAPEFIEQLSALRPDIIVVIAFRILPKEVYSLAKLGAFNVHGSLLPKYRGAAPIQWAIINGETETGLTAFLLNETVDTGNIIGQTRIHIPEDMTSGELFTTLMNPAAELAVSTCKDLLSGNAIALPQHHELATPAPKLFRQTCKIDWRKPSKSIVNLIRGSNPKPGAWTVFNGKPLKILKACSGDPSLLIEPSSFMINEQGFFIGTSDGNLSLLYIQEEGKAAMNVTDFLRGYRGFKEGVCS